MNLNSIIEIISDIKQGKMVILIDSPNRENEGDLIMAAEFITPEAINFMVTHARGLVCLTLTQQKCKDLQLDLMTNNNLSVYGTNFTVSIEASEGVTTGISVADRAKTIKAAINPKATPEDIVKPGHIFPIVAKNGGVLMRAGHTEAGCDLAKLAGLIPSSVIVEILNEDGTMARLPDLIEFAKKHNLKIGSISDLIEYRIIHENNIVKLTEQPKIIKTDLGVN